MIHTKSLIRRLDCVPWLLTACFVLAWAGETHAQAGAALLQVAPATTDTVMLELNKRDVYEYDFTKKDPVASVAIEVTATRVKDGAKQKDADFGSPMLIVLGSASGTGTAASTDVDPADATTNNQTLLSADSEDLPTDRYNIAMPILTIPKDKASAKTEILVAMPGRLINDTDPNTDGNQNPAADDRIWVTGSVSGGGAGTVRAIYFTVRNDDGNTAIWLSIDPSSLKNQDDEKEITVTAHLDSRGAAGNLTFAFKDVTSDEVGPADSPEDTDRGYLALSEGDKLAARDAFYTVRGFGNFVIPEDAISASKKVYIDPVNRDLRNKATGSRTWIAIGSDDDEFEGGVTAVIPGFIELKADDVPKVDTVTEISPPIREDADPAEQTLMVEVALKGDNAAGATTVTIRAEDTDKTGRDTDFIVEVVDNRLVIPKNDTKGTAEILVTPTDNDKEQLQGWNFNVIAQVDDEAEVMEKIEIVDDEADFTGLKLLADPAEIDENAGETKVTITAYVQGKPHTAKLELLLTAGAGDGNTATRNLDYEAALRTLVVPPNAAQASVTISITPEADNKHDGDKKALDETLTISAVSTNPNKTTIGGAADKVLKDAIDAAVITLLDKPKPKDPDPTPEEEVAELASVFSDDEIAAADKPITGTVDTALDDMQLPTTEKDDDGELTYILPGRPAGLNFDDATRTLSGTPTEVGETEVTYSVIDDGEITGSLTYTINIEAKEVTPVELDDIRASHNSVSENSGQATIITLTVTLDKAAAADEKVTLDIVAPTDGKTAVRDTDFDATWIGGPTITIAKGETEGTAQLSLTPKDNTTADGHKFFSVQATSSTDHSAISKPIKIADNESESSAIVLSVDPASVTENGGEVQVTVTATLDGKKQDADVTVSVSIDPDASSAERDVDYAANFDPEARIVISSDGVSGTVTLNLTPSPDEDEEGSETIVLVASAEDLAMGSAAITLEDGGEMMADDGDADDGDADDGDADDGDADDGDADDGDMADDGDADDGDMDGDADDGDLADDGDADDGDMDGDADDGMMMGLHFAEEVADQAYTAGAAITDLVLPEATGGEGDVTYRVFDLPAGLAFDDSTRTISGTPEAATEGAVEVTALAQDGSGAAATLSFNITINPALSFGDLFGAAAGKANPASEHEGAAIPIVVGEELNLTLPEVSGGTPPLTYSVTGLPTGLVFDPDTRTISGTPEAITAEPVQVIYMVTDANGTSTGLPILVAVVAPPLAAPGNLMAEDYRGADGAGDQGGFVMLSWDLSEDHGSIDGYRIFRALPVLGDELVPWAMVDAVPGVEKGRAIVATIDNVSTHWGIASERSGQTTHSTAKAVFVDMNQPYELMAATLMASREAAQVGDAPMFASLLPEALAYAQGVAPKLNLVDGVLSHSEITLTEEPVRAIDNIAPLAVPSFSVLDAPNDGGSRILLTWTLSPSDLLLEEGVVGVHGYSIYRKAGAEGEFAMIAQVDAGVSSFVDETALNGVRYTYQVRPFDLDNETVSDTEQTAMAVRNSVLDSDGRAIFGLFGTDNRIGFDDFFIFADSFGLTVEDAGFDPAFDLAPSARIDFDDFFVFADNFGRSTAAAGKRVPMLAGLNADARTYLDARTAMPSVGEEFVLDVRVADFVAVKGYGLQVQYDASQLEFVRALTDQPLGGSELAAPQVLSDEAGVLALVAHGDVVSDGEVGLSLVFRATTEIEDTVIEITDSQTYDSEFGFNRLTLPAPVQLQTRPEAFALANNYPNPFNPATTIKYALPQAADVELTVYNVVGQVVRTLVAEHQSAGRYVVEWDATNGSGHSLSSGMYFYRLEAGGEFREVKKMLLLK